jgi:2-oxoisovalerate dehydrogenase E1 component
VSPHDESLLLGLGFSPYELMLQLLAKGDDIFSGGREILSSYRSPDKPGIIHQSSAQYAGHSNYRKAQALKYLAYRLRKTKKGEGGQLPLPLFIRDASITE